MPLNFSGLPLRRAAIVFLLSGAMAAYGSPSYAKTQVVLAGTHSKSEINAACDKVGGQKVQGQGGKGYGCYNPDNGALVACNDGGVCTGYVPRGTVRSKGLGILTTGLPPVFDNGGDNGGHYGPGD